MTGVVLRITPEGLGAAELSGCSAVPRRGQGRCLGWLQDGGWLLAAPFLWGGQSGHSQWTPATSGVAFPNCRFAEGPIFPDSWFLRILFSLPVLCCRNTTRRAEAQTRWQRHKPRSMNSKGSWSGTSVLLPLGNALCSFLYFGFGC